MASTTNSSLPKGWPAIVLFGDSITEGEYLISHCPAPRIWHYDSGYSLGAVLTEKFSRRIQVLERGFSGYNSSNARVVVDDVIPPAGGAIDLKLLLVFFGANDAVLPPDQQIVSEEQAQKGVMVVSQHVDIEEYKVHLRAIAQHKNVKDHGAKVVLVTPPPICEHKILPWKDRRSAVAKQYAEAAISVAEETGVEVLKLWHVFMEEAGWKEGEPLLGEIGVPKSEKLGELLSDGLHLTPKGYKLYFESLVKLLENKLPDIYNHKRIFPNWGEAPRYQKPDN
ncbi:hypothetical protein AOL_s00043g497 [Orbilia oligospora ATCC 24927]|uniref:SGNH hydrolase-type esterase domain-containing protein n=2 Tax=Orbilia oligospora TaxID=2813651 RepID=G1X473_ARTOA|nr:hypothetical protein AOL_s00043g497 [Orbilia oligospora ATCC 24927]EGX52107.1 hypothetical protein AOL_s00043g497 [Orbilia oligospora ATCC 24927]KAF3289600.1 hypothetical protein TWF970_003369 [Orbilia oligospora]